MGDAEMLRDALEGRIGQLRRELRETRKILNNLDDWHKAIETHVEAAMRCFDALSRPTWMVEKDPETGQVYACIQVKTAIQNHKDRREQRKAYHRYVRKVSDTKYLELIILDIDVIELEGSDRG